MSAPSTRLRWIDFYRKIPTDLTEATALGGMLSLCAAIFMVVMFVVELMSFLSHTTETMVVLDPGIEQQLRINFNVTLLDLPCRFAVVDVLDVLGTNRMNVSKNIEKWNLDEHGRRRFFQGRNREEREIAHDTHHPELEVLLQNGEHAIPLDVGNFGEYLKNNEYTFVNFYAPWCVWCQRLHPAWEAFAEAVEEDKLPLKVTKVDCAANEALCRDQRVHAFPTLRLFRNEAALPPDYNSDRTVEAMKSYVSRKLNVEEKRKAWPERDTEYKEYPGCLLSGFLLVNRVPGNFHVEPRSKSHNLNAAMTNMSHIVNHLSFGPPVEKDVVRRLERFSSEFYVANTLDGKAFVLDELHKAYHHYVKVVGTMYEVGNNELLTYQMLPESSVMTYKPDDVPEARFNYDISPMSVIVKKQGRRFYEFVTSVFAIIGGVYQVVGLLDHTLYKALKPGARVAR